MIYFILVLLNVIFVTIGTIYVIETLGKREFGWAALFIAMTVLNGALAYRNITKLCEIL